MYGTQMCTVGVGTMFAIEKKKSSSCGAICAAKNCQKAATVFISPPNKSRARHDVRYLKLSEVPDILG